MTASTYIAYKQKSPRPYYLGLLTVASKKKTPSLKARECFLGGSSQTRTGDTRLFRPLLYQLS
jgi:hypothetical protein